MMYANVHPGGNVCWKRVPAVFRISCVNNVIHYVKIVVTVFLVMHPTLCLGRAKPQTLDLENGISEACSGMRQNLDFKRGNEEVLLATLTAYSSVWCRIGVRLFQECRARSLSKKLARERSVVFWLSKFNTTKDSAFPQSCRARGITIFS